jgi:chromosome segregation ATPase
MATATREPETPIVSDDHPDVRRHLQRVSEMNQRIATTDALILSLEAEIPREEETLRQFKVNRALGRATRGLPDTERLQTLTKQLEQARDEQPELLGAKAHLEAETQTIRNRAAVQMQAWAEIRRIVGEQMPLVEKLEALQREMVATSQRHKLAIGGDLSLLFFNLSHWKNAAVRASR